ncbi:MAG: flagellar biosynthesis protein FlhF [Peptococcales bacterium]|jgi:flagellar biosynthesis protein FlhF
MRVKRFVANNIQEAMLKVKIEMGKDAIILHTRKFKEGGFLGFFAKEFVEVTAAIDNEYPEPKIENQVTHASNKQIVWPEINETTPVENEDTDNKQKTGSINEEQVPDSTNDFADMKKLMQEMMEQIENASLNLGLNKIGEKFYQCLINNEVEDKFAKRLVKKCLDKIPPDKFEDENFLREHFLTNISQILKKPKPITISNKRKQQVIALVGPTGVGKTTTIAKLAANFTLNNQQNIALITSDTYRIAAVEQLKTVGDLIGVPVEVVFTPQSMKNSVFKHADKDLVFIDTAGRSHKNALQMGELKAFIDAADPDEIFLVLSATTKYKDMIDIVNNYQKINFNRIIFTKLDETSTYGPILSTIQQSKKYLSYFTTGQNVPDDIEVADQKKIAELILRDGAK